MNLISALKLIFSENAFVRAELERLEKKRLAGEAYQPAADFAPEARARVKEKRRNLAKSLLWIALLVMCGIGIAALINAHVPLSWSSVRAVRAISIVFLAWAVWSKIGDIDTFKRETLLELTSQYLYKLLYSAGIFLGSVALFLEGGSGA